MLSIYTIAFFSGLAVMGIELSASRLIAPYYGTSIFVWTNVIAVILAALSLGYYLGGRVSEAHPRLKVLLSIILTAGILAAIIPFVIKPVAMTFAFDPRSFLSVSVLIIFGSFLLTLLLFFLPIMLLGMTSPFLIKLVSRERSDMGNASGRIFAISTVGSIIGTFLPALVFIPLVGTKAAILIFAALLIAMGLFGLLPKRLFLVIPLAGLPFGALDSAFKAEHGLIYQDESAYQYIQVFERDGERQLVYNEGGGVQSVWRAHTVWTGRSYFDVIPLGPALLSLPIDKGKQEGVRKALIIGSAGGSAARTMRALYGDRIEITGIEIDGMVTEVARQYFDLEESGMRVVTADGRNILRFDETLYDIIVVDAYSNQLYIPFHLSTREFFELIKRRLAPGGAVLMNVNASSEDSYLLRLLENTIASVFTEVYHFEVKNTWNFVLFAGEKLEFGRLAAVRFPGYENFESLAREVAKDAKKIVFDGSLRVFTDDWAPLEHLTDSMILEYILNYDAEIH